MLSICSRIAVIVAVAGLLWLPTASLARNPQGQEPTEPATVTASSERAAALGRLSAGQVSVTYENGELTIIAKSVPLVRILQEVRTQIGIAIAFSPRDADEPIFVALGPGPVKDVIVSLLDGSQLNYAMARSADDPNELASLTVFPRTKDPSIRARVPQEQASRQKDSSKSTASNEGNSGFNQLVDLVASARAESGGAALYLGEENAEDADAQANAKKINVDDVLTQLEAQVKVIAQSSQQQPTGVETSDNSAADAIASAPAPMSPVVRRHRRRH